MKLQETRKHLLLSLFIALVFALTIYPTKAQAQIIGQLDVNVPFQFHAGNTKFPSGKYFIHLLDDSDLTVMEISSADGSTSALVRSSDDPGKLHTGQERIDLQQIRESVLPCEGV